MLRDEAPKGRHGIVRRARALRRQMTPPEVMLWVRLRARPSGLKFRRQHPTGPYVADFYCGDARLVIEIDGSGHGAEPVQARDAVRDAWLDAHGIATVCVPAGDVMRDCDAVADAIVRFAQARLPLHHPAAPGGPPPRDGLGED